MTPFQLHQIIAMDALFKKANSNKHLIYVGDGGDVNSAIFNEIKTSFGTPVLSEWKTWLIRQIQEDKKVEIMEGNAQLARLNLNEKYLDSVVSAGVRERTIRF